MRSTRGPNAGWRERGAAAVELAIIMPLLLLFIAGIVDFGRYFLTEIQLTNAAREGARVAVIEEPAANVVLRVETAAPAVSNMTITTPRLCPGDDAEVTVSTPFDWILLGPSMSLFGAASTLPTTAHSTAVMRCGG